MYWVCCSVLQRVASCCSMLQRSAILVLSVSVGSTSMDLIDVLGVLQRISHSALHFDVIRLFRIQIHASH